jgi:uncharacterized protein (DUF58 family)
VSALFVVDVSRSMDFPSGGRTKFEMARSVAAILGTLVLDQGDAAGVLAVDERAHLVPARSGHHHLRVMLAALASLTPRGSAPLGDALRRAATLLKRRGLVVVISDFYDDEDSLAQIRRLSRMGHDVMRSIRSRARSKRSTSAAPPSSSISRRRQADGATLSSPRRLRHRVCEVAVRG